MLRAPKGVTGDFTVSVTAYDGTNTPTTRTFTVDVVADTATGECNPWASETPAAPTSIVFQPQSGQGTTTITSVNNSSTAKELKFLVSGVTAGDQVTVYADGVAIGSGTARELRRRLPPTAPRPSSMARIPSRPRRPRRTFPQPTARFLRTETANVDSLSSPAASSRSLPAWP